MGVTSQAAEAYRRYKTGKKAYDYYKLAKGALDEDSRSGSLFKAGIKVTADVAKRVLGTSISSHPYFTYHKVHFEALAQALNASEMKDMATSAFNRAVGAADSTARVTATLQTFMHRRQALTLAWYLTLAETLNMRARYRANPTAGANEIKVHGMTPAILNTYIEDALYAWRATWSELASDATELYLMVDAETRIAEAAMARYNEKVKKLKEGKSAFGRIAGYAAERDRQFEYLDRATGATPGKLEQVVEDPARYARRQRDAADAMANRLARACDIAMSDAVETPDKMQQKLDAVMTMGSP